VSHQTEAQQCCCSLFHVTSFVVSWSLMLPESWWSCLVLLFYTCDGPCYTSSFLFKLERYYNFCFGANFSFFFNSIVAPLISLQLGVLVTLTIFSSSVQVWWMNLECTYFLYLLYIFSAWNYNFRLVIWLITWFESHNLIPDEVMYEASWILVSIDIIFGSAWCEWGWWACDSY
jgi:hypothetical protein